ncbi:MAG: winged helix DNA-binding domain-containing protein [Aeromicrobium erythreum]
MRTVDDAERRARLGVRHALAPDHRVDDPVAAAEAVLALHGTDPASTVLSVLARAPRLDVGDVAAALYDDRSLVRVLTMRRTVFAVRTDRAPDCLAACDGVAATERRKLVKAALDAGVDDPEAYVERVEAEALAVFDDLETVTTKDLAAASDLLAQRLVIGSGRWTAEVAVASRVLTVLSARGLVVRGRPRGGWTSTQFTWSRSDRWAPVLAERPDPQEAAVRVAGAWLARHGPATLDDVQWWSGWTRSRTRAALAALDTVEVETSAGPALLLAEDADPVDDPGTWTALLPALDPAVMGWKHRDHLLGPHREELFDVNGNAGPTVWVDGRVVGGWAQRADGEVVVDVLEDVGAEARAAVDDRAAALTARLGDVRLAARARGWTPVEKRLRA